MVAIWDKAVEPEKADQPTDLSKLTSFQLGQRLSDTNKKIEKSEQRLKDRQEELVLATSNLQAEQNILNGHKARQKKLEQFKTEAFLQEAAQSQTNPAGTRAGGRAWPCSLCTNAGVPGSDVTIFLLSWCQV